MILKDFLDRARYGCYKNISIFDAKDESLIEEYNPEEEVLCHDPRNYTVISFYSPFQDELNIYVRAIENGRIPS